MLLSKNLKKAVAITGLLICLGAVNWSIIGKEKHLTHGQSLYVELAPVDPRSLIQGDYMALNFKITNQIRAAIAKTKRSQEISPIFDAQDGFAVLVLDKENKATFKDLHDQQPVAASEILVRYRMRNGAVKFATNAFFFQEGKATHYEKAKFGHFRVNKSGDLLLTSMHDQQLRDLAVENN